MELLVLQLFKLIAQVDIPSMDQLVFFKVKFNVLKELGMEQVVLLFLMVNALLTLLGMEQSVLLMSLQHALKVIHSMELCVFLLSQVSVLKDMFKEEHNVTEKQLYLVQVMLDGMEHHA